ncbi:glycogen/starch synthase, ADP-glucose type [Ammonifex degensii KC4]|uniref:Glycogen synthase n=1 Tax=Ammonifex degensii (strain DSM 10501 / KC4) TaxID=429009 RepID=C9RBH6_AMMDK|nr:glycogen synthase GlgA [Ammonifex degensii]ACX51603.1 glycogen/starch synthase, ADP-glucose type [Ammonifex degensii KC4]
MFDRSLKILFVASEAVPFAKVGGLADVAGSLPKALAVGPDERHNDVRLVIPYYKNIEDTSYLMDFPVPLDGRLETCVLRQGKIEAHYRGEYRSLPVYFIGNYHYFWRDGIYAFPDDAERYAFFCWAVLEMLPRLNWQPDIIHCNDWQTGPIPLLLHTHYQGHPFYQRTATVFTIHNLQYQGNFPWEKARLFNLGDEYYHPEALEFYGQFSFMKAGLLYADVISTVSRTYAREIQTPAYGERMDGVLRRRSRDLYGIVNGINYHEFNPKTDPRLHRNYDLDTLEDKRENKYALQREMGLPVKDVPVLGIVSRLVAQKGLDLVAEIAPELMHLEVQLVVLGTGDPRYHRLFEELKRLYPQKVGLYLGFNPVLAQRIYAGADIFLMPSRFEPCGLGQLIAMRYGTIPVVRATGGLADTVQEFDPVTLSGNGFVFKEYNAREFYRAIARALKLYRDHPDSWRRLMRNAMSCDFSWARSAVEYLQLYQEALNRRLAAARIA